MLVWEGVGYGKEFVSDYSFFFLSSFCVMLGFMIEPGGSKLFIRTIASAGCKVITLEQIVYLSPLISRGWWKYVITGMCSE